MPRYYFEVLDGDRITADDDGLELDGIEAACEEAIKALAGIAKDALPGTARREIAIDVTDEANEPVLKAALSFKVTRLR